MRLFPSSPRTRFLKGYFIYAGVSLQEEDGSEEEDENLHEETEGGDPIDDMTVRRVLKHDHICCATLMLPNV